MSKKSSPSPKRELVLGGGGIKGFGHPGTLEALQERGLEFGRVVGVSIGSAIAAFYANGYKPRDITPIFLKELRKLDFAALSRAVTWSRPLKLIRAGGIIDLEQLFTDVVCRYGLKPQPNLVVIAYDVRKRKPVIFQGTQYNLAKAVAASCAVPALMRAVWYGEDDESPTSLLMDGGIYDPAPVDFCLGPAIISRLGLCTKLPSTRLNSVDYALHLVEWLISPIVNAMFKHPGAPHVVIDVGKPDVATMTFGLDDERCLSMVDYAYKAASIQLDRAIAQGLL